MPDNSSRWEPGRNAVHRLIQLLDALAIAFNRFRQQSFHLPTHHPPQRFDTEAWQSGVTRLRAEFDAVRDAIAAGYVSPARRAERLADEAIAEFARAGTRDDATITAVAEAAQWLGYVATPWNVGTPRPWNYGVLDPADIGSYVAMRGTEEKFDREFALLEQYSVLRRGLLSVLARTGQTVPAEIDRRAALSHHSWPEGESGPTTQEELLAMVHGTEHTPASPQLPPVPPVPDPLAPRNAADEFRAIAAQCNEIIETLSPGNFTRNALETIPVGRQIIADMATRGVGKPIYEDLERCWERARQVSVRTDAPEAPPDLPATNVLSHAARNFLVSLGRYCNRMAVAWETTQRPERELRSETRSNPTATSGKPVPHAPLCPAPLSTVRTEAQEFDSAFARLAQEIAAREQRDVEARSERAEKMRQVGEFHGAWSAAWSRLLNNFDTAAQYRLKDAEGAASDLAEVCTLVARLGEVREDMRNDPAECRLQSLYDYQGWRGRGAPIAAALLLDALSGRGPSVLTQVLRHAEREHNLRVAFGWLEFYRDRLLPPPMTRHPIGVLEVVEAMPAVEYHPDDLRFAQAQLVGWRDILGALAAIPDDAQRRDEPNSSDSASGPRAEELNEQQEGAVTDTAPAGERQNTDAPTPSLSTRQADVLRALLRLNANGQTRRVTRVAVAKDINRTWDETKIARDLRYLSGLGYTNSQTGPDGGVWLSTTGRRRAEGLRTEEEN